MFAAESLTDKYNNLAFKNRSALFSWHTRSEYLGLPGLLVWRDEPLFLAVVLFRLNWSGRVRVPHHTLIMNTGSRVRVTGV